MIFFIYQSLHFIIVDNEKEKKKEKIMSFLFLSLQVRKKGNDA